jgi:MazG family protein
MDDAEKAGKQFAELVRILDVLRGENGCPWDRQQDEKSLVNYFLEESYEVIDSIFNENPDSVAEELGDMLMEIVFLARLYKEKADFCMSDVVEGINRKMIRRHPHVFGEHTVADADEVTLSWNRQKNTEKSRDSLLDGISSCTPALLTAFQIGLRASLYGFDWPEAGAVFAKVKEEMLELEEAVGKKDLRGIMEEIGDLLFALANLSRHLGVNPEIALQFANRKFTTRFRFIERTLKDQGRDIEGASLEEMEELWQLAKKER